MTLLKSISDYDNPSNQIQIESVFAVYNKMLISNFINTYSIQQHRWQTAQSVFWKQSWKKEDKDVEGKTGKAEQNKRDKEIQTRCLEKKKRIGYKREKKELIKRRT